MSAEGSSGGIGFFGLLGVVFITLKLIGIDPVASWSWWWVMAPIWGPAVLAVVVICVVGIFLGLMAAWDSVAAAMAAKR